MTGVVIQGRMLIFCITFEIDMKNFALIGVAGFVAPRHMKAIRETGNNLSCAYDLNDSVGIMDSYFPKAHFFTEHARFDRYLDRLYRESGKSLDFISICTPNHLHDSQIRHALNTGANAICEKPMVLNPWNVDALSDFEKEHEGNINCILQLRLHDTIKALKKQIDDGAADKVYDVELTYIASRGRWYHNSWKADMEKSGGIATNIGVHFFDMLSWIFGDVAENIVHVHDDERAAGYLRLKNARVRWFLSVNYNDLPKEIKEKGQRTYRSINIDGNEVEFSDGFTDLHTKSYQEILNGNGFRPQEVKSSIQIVSDIRNIAPIGLVGDFHPLANK